MYSQSEYLGKTRCCNKPISIKGNEGPTGPQGPIGPQGFTGATGPAGEKTFVIDHPIHEEKYLVHACLEGPEAGVYYRGIGEIINNENVTIYLPDYVSTFASDFTVQITSIYDGKPRVYSSSLVESNCFHVYGENGKFFWLVQGKRSSIVVEPCKKDVELKGNGPYLWI